MASAYGAHVDIAQRARMAASDFSKKRPVIEKVEDTYLNTSEMSCIFPSSKPVEMVLS